MINRLWVTYLSPDIPVEEYKDFSTHSNHLGVTVLRWEDGCEAHIPHGGVKVFSFGRVEPTGRTS